MARTAHRFTPRSRAMVLRPTFMSPYRAPASRPIVVKQTRVVKAKRHHFSRVRGHAYEERHRIGAVLAAFGLGLIDKSGIDLPALPYAGKAGTLGLLAYAAEKWGKMKWAGPAATGFLCVASYELGKAGHIDGYVAGGGYPDLDGYVAGY